MVEVLVELPRVTDHDVPEASPDSVNVTVYLFCVNVTATFTLLPFTVTDPDAGEAVYPLTDPTVYE